MTVFFYSMLRAASRDMDREELALAKDLAALAEKGNQAAEAELRRLVDSVLTRR